jgi:hypothetical protein
MFVDARGHVSFEKLLKLALQDVSMQLPKAFSTIVKLRNAIIHRGFIRETDSVTRYIFGQLDPGTVHTAVFETMEQVQDYCGSLSSGCSATKDRFCCIQTLGAMRTPSDQHGYAKSFP